MSVYNFTEFDLKGSKIDLSQYKGYISLIVNIASNSKFNNQLNDLEKLYRKYKDNNFIIFAFPCDQFGKEPLADKQLIDYYINNFKLSFPIMKKVSLNPTTSPIYKWVKFESGEMHETVKGDFTKLLFDRTGNYVRSFKGTDDIAMCDSYIRSFI